jgi:hypothetical protein
MLIDKGAPTTINALDDVDTVDVAALDKRKTYVKPQLEEMGDLRTLTLGITQGINESGPYSPNHW